MITFKTIEIKGYRGFKESGPIELCVPNGEAGSGLNIFVGENGSGKTTLLKAISFLTMNSFSGQSKISSFDFNNKVDNCNIEIIATVSEGFEYAMPSPYKKSLTINQFKISIKNRDRKSPSRLLSPTYTISNILEPDNRSPLWFKGEIPDFYLAFDNDRFPNGEDLHIFYYDEERHRQSRKGFATTFTRVAEDLNWRFLKDADQKEVMAKWKEYYQLVAPKNHIEKVKKFFGKKFRRDILDGLGLELLSLKEPFKESFFGIGSEDNLSQIPLASLGSGIELLFSILYLKEIANQSGGSVILCIDEPELSLHPQWQKIFLEILKEESKDKQIFISTHSAYFIDPSLLGNVKRFCQEDDGIEVSSLDNDLTSNPKAQKLFGLENREIFFSQGVILVEGIDDKVRMRGFLGSENTNLFVMDGLQNLPRTQAICDQLDINFRTIVDLDYLRAFDELMPDLTVAEAEYIDEVKSLTALEGKITDEKLSKELNKIKRGIIDNKLKCLSSKIKLKMDSDADYKRVVMNKIKELQADGIFVLEQGMIEDYLDENGIPKSPELEKELQSTLDFT